jgi:pimeloyl-ACP methyl ester carboxylesterase
MKYRVFLLLLVILTGCATQPPVPAIVPTSASTSSPIESPTAAPTLFLSPTAVTPPPGQEIIFDESGDKKFAGTIHGSGETAIILANMSVGGEAQWNPFVAAVDQRKFTTVTFNYRNINAPEPDIRLVLDTLKEKGFERIVCIGASMGTSVCNIIAREPEMVGLVLIAGAVHHASVAETTYPKLFIAAAQDRSAYDIQAGYEKAAQPKTLLLFENERAHGTDLFRSKDSDAFLKSLLDFVNELANP